MLIHVERYMRVLHVAAIYNRNLERANKGRSWMQVSAAMTFRRAAAMAHALTLGKRVVMSDPPSLIAQSPIIDVVFEAVGNGIWK